MISITPQGNIYLCNVPLENDYKNQLTFTNKENQETYFNSKIITTFDNYTYIKKDSVIKVGVNIDDIIGCNYLFYRNVGFTNKIYYCFITNKEYINENVTALTIETDVFQTYQFDMEFEYSFVEREHVDDDTVGKHTITENLVTGDYICNSVSSLFSGGNTTYITIATSALPDEIPINVLNRQYNGIYSGCNYIVFQSPLAASDFIRAMDALGQGEAIQSIFLIPISLTGTVTFTTYNVPVPGSSQTITFEAGVPPYSTGAVELGTVNNIVSPTLIDGYTPHNNKLFTYPYNYFFITNNSGSDVTFHYEDFVNNTASFKTVGSITPSCSIKCFPLNYKKLADTNSSSNSYNYGITGAKYPICSWVSDSYINWLTQNGINVAGISLNAKDAAMIGAIGSGLGDLATNLIGGTALAGGLGGLAGVGMGLVDMGTDIFNVMVENQRRELTPDSTKGNINSGDVNYSFDKMDIPLYKMTIRSEYAKIIDQYFDMFGYKVNEVKIPNLNSRVYWNYIKTIGCQIKGNIPQEHLNVLKGIFDKGLTLWHNSEYFLDYSRTNAIVS